MMQSTASCLCGRVQLNLKLPKPIQDYSPRLCNCDFCTKRQAAYLSDPEGVLEVAGKEGLESFKQGSEQALFWQCKFCHSLIVVSYEFENGVKGAVNARLFATKYQLGDTVVASPKKLSPDVKRERWQALWLKVKFRD